MAAESAFASGFDEAGFRDAIEQTMLMGMPPDPADQLTWHWRRTREYDPQDRIKKPYDWTETPVVDQPGNPDEPDGTLIVTYALEFQPRNYASGGSVLGTFNTSRAVVTLLDTEYEKVKDADFCTIGTSAYEIDYAGPAMGLFAVAVHQVYLTARDES